MSSEDANIEGEEDWFVVDSFPKICEMHIETNVINRYAKTLITSTVENISSKAQEATFSIITPDQAFISEFILEIDGKKYVSYVKEKEEAKTTYNEAVASGHSAAHVAASARDSNRFTVSINVKSNSKAIFYLRYEELLIRKNYKYEIVLNMHPGQWIENFQVVVNILESRALKFIEVPVIRSGNELSKNTSNVVPEADIKITEMRGTVMFKPDIAKQKALNLNEKEEGLNGQFVVLYDVDRDPQGGEVLVDESGYFVHFFAPEDLHPLKKQVIFVLDVSGSMNGRKIIQLKEAMCKILSELKLEDTFSIVDFSSVVSVWNIPSMEISFIEGEKNYTAWYGRDPLPQKMENVLPPSFKASETNIKNAKEVIEKILAQGGTDIQSALDVGLRIVAANLDPKSHQPIIVFLTDGEPTVGVTNTETIISKITELNNQKVPIFTLSFGDGADRQFLQKLSLRNQGFTRHIYEAADASLQLEDFYRQISSPLLTNINFKYVDKVQEVTRTHFPILFDGSELYTTGCIGPNFVPPPVEAWGSHGIVFLEPHMYKVTNSLERLWAYLTIKKLLEQRKIEDNKALLEEALKLALKYSFVTEVSSLVVVKPDAASTINTEDASKKVLRSSPALRFKARKGVTFGRTVSSASQTLCASNSFGLDRALSGVGSIQSDSIHKPMFQFGAAPQQFSSVQPQSFSKLESGFGVPSQGVGSIQPVSIIKSMFGFGAAPQQFSSVQLQSFSNLESRFGVPSQGFDSFKPESANKSLFGFSGVLPDKKTLPPEIYEMRVITTVAHGYAKTSLTGRMKNNNSIAQKLTLSIKLPERAFISQASMEVQGNKYVAYILDNDKAEQVYDKDVEYEKVSGYIAVSENNFNEFIVSINLEANNEGTLDVQYEELLARKNNVYEVINFVPDQLADNSVIQIHINETRPVRIVETNFEGKVSKVNEELTIVKFRPDIMKQNVFTGDNVKISKQYVVLYDIDNSPASEVLVDDGHVVNPLLANLTEQKTHIIVLLDVSTNITANFKNALTTILNQLRIEDAFSFLECSSVVTFWDVLSSTIAYQCSSKLSNFQDIPHCFKPSEDNFKKVKEILETTKASGQINTELALTVALEFASIYAEPSYKPIILFLTDSSDAKLDVKIISKITQLNTEKIPIFSVTFGSIEENNVLQTLCLKNFGFARRIFNFADAVKQLDNFYKEMSLALSEVTFRDITELDVGVSGLPDVEPQLAKARFKYSHLERHWAYPVVKEQMEQRRDKTLKEPLTNRLEFQYSFITDISSLALVKQA